MGVCETEHRGPGNGTLPFCLVEESPLSLNLRQDGENPDRIAQQGNSRAYLPSAGYNGTRHVNSNGRTEKRGSKACKNQVCS